MKNKLWFFTFSGLIVWVLSSCSVVDNPDVKQGSPSTPVSLYAEYYCEPIVTFASSNTATFISEGAAFGMAKTNATELTGIISLRYSGAENLQISSCVATFKDSAGNVIGSTSSSSFYNDELRKWTGTNIRHFVTPSLVNGRLLFPNITRTQGLNPKTIARVELAITTTPITALALPSTTFALDGVPAWNNGTCSAKVKNTGASIASPGARFIFNWGTRLPFYFTLNQTGSGGVNPGASTTLGAPAVRPDYLSGSTSSPSITVIIVWG